MTIWGDLVRTLGNGLQSGEAAPLSISPGDWVVVTPLEERDGRLTPSS